MVKHKVALKVNMTYLQSCLLNSKMNLKSLLRRPCLVQKKQSFKSKVSVGTDILTYF